MGNADVVYEKCAHPCIVRYNQAQKYIYTVLLQPLYAGSYDQTFVAQKYFPSELLAQALRWLSLRSCLRHTDVADIRSIIDNFIIT